MKDIFYHKKSTGEIAHLTISVYEGGNRRSGIYWSCSAHASITKPDGTKGNRRKSHDFCHPQYSSEHDAVTTFEIATIPMWMMTDFAKINEAEYKNLLQAIQEQSN